MHYQAKGFIRSIRSFSFSFGRIAFSPENLRTIVAPKANGDKQVEAYNLCDGHTSQSDIAKKTGLDGGNLSRSISRWVEEGVMFRVEPDNHPLHIYPLRKGALKRMKKAAEIDDE